MIIAGIFPSFLLPTIGLFYFVIPGLIIYLVYTWVNKFLDLRREQNDLMRELIRKIENKL